MRMANWIDKWRHHQQLITAAAIGLALLLPGCDRSTEPEFDQPSAQVELSPVEKRRLAEASQAAWQLAEPAIDQSLFSAQQLQQAVEALLRDPTPQSLTVTQDQWRRLAAEFQPLHVYGSAAQLRPEALQPLHQMLFDLAAQPIQPGYLDKIGPYAHSGIVHDIGLAMTAESLRHQHGATDEEEAALGLYAMQFMLFGVEPHSPRQAADFVAQELAADDIEQGYGAPNELPNNRRRQLLQVQAELLTDDLQRLQTLWQPETPPVLADALQNLDVLQRHTLLLRTLQLELLDLSAAVETLGQAPDAEQSADPAAPMASALELPQLARARADFLLQLSQTLALDQALIEQLEQVVAGLEQTVGDAGVVVADSAQKITGISDSLARALEQVTRILREYTPTSSPIDNAGNLSLEPMSSAADTTTSSDVP